MIDLSGQMTLADGGEARERHKISPETRQKRSEAMKRIRRAQSRTPAAKIDWEALARVLGVMPTSA